MKANKKELINPRPIPSGDKYYDIERTEYVLGSAWPFATEFVDEYRIELEATISIGETLEFWQDWIKEEVTADARISLEGFMAIRQSAA